MISYRSDEAIDCVGMQLLVEPGLGLCGNLKPNRFFVTERKRFTSLANVGLLFIFAKEYSYMDLLQLSANAWKEMINQLPIIYCFMLY